MNTETGGYPCGGPDCKCEQEVSPIYYDCNIRSVRGTKSCTTADKVFLLNDLQLKVQNAIQCENGNVQVVDSPDKANTIIRAYCSYENHFVGQNAFVVDGYITYHKDPDTGEWRDFLFNKPVELNAKSCTMKVTLPGIVPPTLVSCMVMDNYCMISYEG